MPITTASGPELGALAPTGISGLDAILGGGFTRNRFYLVEGMPGAGKTTLALQFLLHGAANGESVMYVALSETEEELRSVAHSHGWSLEGVDIREMVSPEQALDPQEQLTMFYPSEVELSETSRAILSEVERLRPTRVVFDSLSEFRLIAGQALQYRRQVLALKQYFAGQRCTVNRVAIRFPGPARRCQQGRFARPGQPDHGADPLIPGQVANRFLLLH